MTGKPGRGRRDKMDIYPGYLMFLNGETVETIARDFGLTIAQMRKRINQLRALEPSALEAVRQEALARRRRQVEIEFLRGDPLKATRLANADAAVRKVDRARAEALDAAAMADEPDENKPDEEAAIDDAARQARDDAFLCRYILGQDEAGVGESVEDREPGGPRRDPYRLPLPRDGPATPAAG
ncbi:hypothetical protein [uncultured Maricaulis sp.]|uniref:hypothetical protein n=1 Tax=uncultured Maricaulis sp. TaxID=174710 RepID=UPI0030DD995B